MITDLSTEVRKTQKQSDKKYNENNGVTPKNKNRINEVPYLVQKAVRHLCAIDTHGDIDDDGVFHIGKVQWYINELCRHTTWIVPDLEESGTHIEQCK